MSSVALFLGLILGGISILILLLANISAFARGVRRRKLAYMTLAIRVPKTSEVGPVVAEQIFATLHGFAHELSWFDHLIGKENYRMSFEIAAFKRTIKFYVWFPVHLRTLVEGQIYAQYPDAEIEEIPDYVAAIEEEKLSAHAVGAEIGMSDPVIFPIKRHPQFEDKVNRSTVDPLAAMTATLSQLIGSDDTAAIQLVIQPLENKWRLIYLKCLRIVSKGVFGNIDSFKKKYINLFITRSWKLKVALFPLYIYFWGRGITSGMKGGSIAVEASSSSHGGDDELREEMSRGHDRETDTAAAVDKIAKLMFGISIRVLYVPKEANPHGAEVKVREIAGSFKQFNIPHLNGFELERITHGTHSFQHFLERHLEGDVVLNTEELATVYHLPHMSVATPNIAWVRSRKLEPPSDLPGTHTAEVDAGFTLLGKTNFRGVRHEFGIKTSDRRRHIYIIGKTGMGKSTLLENMIFSDIKAGRGVAIVDPHGDLADHVMDFVPSHRTNDVILFDPSDRDFPIAFNMLENVDPAYNTIVASGLVGIFKKMYAESWGPRLEHILRNTILALLEYPNTTMLGITRILQDRDFRRRVIAKVTDPIVKSFWVNEFEKMDPKMRVEAISPILNKVGQFLSSPIIRNIVGQPKSSVNLRFAMDKKKIVIVNLSKGKIGEDNSSLLGAMMITKFQLDAMSRATQPESERVDFYLYVDEFQNFATESFATILSEARKYRLNLTMANQYIAQMPEEVRDAVFGNVGTLNAFQVGFDDAEVIAGQFGGDETMVNDLVALPVGSTYLRLLIDGMPTPVFSMATFPPPKLELDPQRREKILKFCRERYSAKREVVEDKIKRWSEGANVGEASHDEHSR